MNTTDWLDTYLLGMPGATKDYKAEWGWDRYMVGGKMYAATCLPGQEHAAEYANHPLLTLKCDPLESEVLRNQYPDILPGFYCNKRTWISVRLDGPIPDDLLKHLCDNAYRLVLSKLPKRLHP